MKKLLYMCIFTSSTLFVWGKSTHKSNRILQIGNFCEHVHERAYFLKRIEKMISLLEIFDNSIHINTNFSDFHEFKQFTHPKIAAVISHLETQTNLKPFFILWRSLSEYQYIHDELLIKEFSQLALVITRKLRPMHISKSKQPPHDIAFNLTRGTYTEAITYRTYCTKRLERPLRYLHTIHNVQDCFHITTTLHEKKLCIFDTLCFAHPCINKCIKDMVNNQSLKPLFELAHNYTQFKLIQDDRFNREFLLLVFGLYKNLVHNSAAKKRIAIKHSTLSIMTELYKDLDSLPLEQILDAIDLLSQELPHLLEEYDFKKDTNWREWIKTHWWVPPVIFVTLGIKVYLLFKYAKPKLVPEAGYVEPL